MNSKYKRIVYDKEVMDKAIEAVKSGTPINTASKLYKVPRSSLHSKIIKKYNHEKTGPGTVLTSEEENNLVQWILHMCSVGCPVNKDHLINSVAVLIKKLNKQTPFIDGRPGRHWYEGFLRRHPLLRKRISENVSLSRALVSEESVRKWFKDVGYYLKEKNLENIDSSRIFNTDETALLLNPKAGSVLARKGSKNVYNIVNNNEKENLTVLITGNAAGQLAPTLVVFNYKRVPNPIYSTLPQEFHVGKSEKGWMTAMLFYEYIANKFLPWIVANNIQLPVILFLDGHVSHLTQPLSEFCHTHQIVLINLPPNTTHFMQPMDVSMFSPLKDYWKKEVNNYRIEKEVLSVSKKDFAPLLEKVFNNMDLGKILSNGFQICGLHPFSVEAVDFTKVFIRSKNQPNTETTSKNDLTTQLVLVQSIQKYIDQSTLETFRSCKNVEKWAGPTEDKNLFYLWQKILNDYDQIVAECNSKVNNEMSVESEQVNDEADISQSKPYSQIMDSEANVQPLNEILHAEDSNAKMVILQDNDQKK
ncbi:PREDICTED: tigger transposable element-derived protein 1-like isoform X2 [Wasmannia auropunctata]|uniref:tigger transposable element-derived protein 1-like isoform X2 n=1 Tax=Wasmannia auropunctata TaxID=64793 RepID=UPI0005EF65C5|nr:PREDICTED: tigger transposable element-derived protein 1-like isoform X2 [Wasmannia auropunctata]